MFATCLHILPMMSSFCEIVKDAVILGEFSKCLPTVYSRPVSNDCTLDADVYASSVLSVK